MSENLVLHRDIDMLVQAALVGCLGDPWPPLVADPDAWGADLLDRNWYVVVGSAFGDTYDEAAELVAESYGPDEGMTRPTGYRFQPFPGMLTGAEVRRACEYYRYQTACDWDDPLSEGPIPGLEETMYGRVLAEIERRVARSEGPAPWGYDDSLVEAMSGRPAPEIPERP